MLAFLQPPDLSDEVIVRARLMRFMSKASSEKFEATVAKIMAAPNPPVPISQPVPEITHPRYGGLGTHPDLIERLWHLDTCLPRQSRWVVYGSPALVHPVSGVIFGFAKGTLGYALRLLLAVRAETDQRGYIIRRTARSFEDGIWDIAQAGPEWRLGLWWPAEDGWCRAAYDDAA